MKIKILFPAIFVLFISFSVHSQTQLVPNGSFEAGQEKPEGWALTGENGVWAEGGAAGGRCLSVVGTGQDMCTWHCPAAVEAGRVYRLSFDAKSDNGDGNVVAGCGKVNHNFKPDREWVKCWLVFALPADNARPELRLGQWHRPGATYFDNVSLTEVTPVHTVRNGVALGGGEKVHGRHYTCIPLGFSEGGNYSRCLDEATAGYHTHAWIFSPASHVIYKHQIGDTQHTRAEVRVRINHHVSGRCLVEASADGKNWIALGTLEGRSDKKFDIPQNILPASAVYIRLKTGEISESPKDETLGNFQIDYYDFQSELNADFPDMTGYTAFFEKAAQKGNVDVKILSMDGPLSGGDTKMNLSIENHRSVSLALKADLAIQNPSQTQSPAGSTAEIQLKPNEKKDIAIPYSLYAAGENTMALTVKTDTETLWRAAAMIPLDDYYDSSYGYSLGQNSDLQWWWCESTYKVSRERPAPAGGDVRSVDLFAARGEYEPVQVVLRPRRDLKDIRIAVEAADPIWKEAVRIYTVAYHSVQQCTDSSGCVGWWPDALPPFEKPAALAAGFNQPFWILARIPDNCPAGDHKLSLKITGDGLEAIVVPVSIHVYDFQIPPASHIQSAFGVNPENIKRYHNLETIEDQRAVWDLYMQSFRDHRISPYTFAPFDPIQVEFKESSGADGAKTLKPTVDFSAWDVQARKYLDGYGFTSFVLPLQGLGGGRQKNYQMGRLGPFEQGTPEYRKIFKEYCLTLQNHLEENRWLSKSFLYWYDEPEESDYDFVRSSMEEIKLAGPRLTRMLTEQPEEKLFGAVDLWCPVLDQFKPEACQQRQREGEKIWWYVCTGPKAPYPTLFIDHNAIELRIWLWMSWKWNVQGILIWEALYWTSPYAFPPPAIQNPWQDPMGYCHSQAGVWGNGDGRMLYPPNRDAANDKSRYLQGPVSSIRWEMLREGLEDYEYFWLLKEAIAKARLAGVSRDILTEAQRLLDIPPDTITDLTHFTRDPQRLFKHRREIAGMIEKLNPRTP
jgi:hypothetical protein